MILVFQGQWAAIFKQSSRQAFFVRGEIAVFVCRILPAYQLVCLGFILLNRQYPLAARPMIAAVKAFSSKPMRSRKRMAAGDILSGGS